MTLEVDKPVCPRCLGWLIDPVGTPGDSLIACRACGGNGRADAADLARAQEEQTREHGRWLDDAVRQ